MSILDEITASASASAMNAALRAGAEAVSGVQEVTFSKYTRKILPLDGFAYWVRSSLLGDTAADKTVRGSLHLAFDKQQNPTEVFSRVAVTFTSEQDVAQNFEAMNQDDILIATAAASTLGEQVTSLPGNFNDNFNFNFTGSSEQPAQVRFAFSRLGFYQNAGVFHYAGVALFPYAVSQIVDTQDQLDALPDTLQVVSNSLPAWLRLNGYSPFYGFGNQVPLYPSMLVASNATPPFGVVDIPPESTEAMASVPYLSRNYTHSQLSRDRVKVTFYGTSNDQIMNFMDCVLQYSEDYNVVGLLNAPIVRDEKSTQPELSILAAKKSVTFDVSYLQVSVRNLARQLILAATSTVREVYPASWPDNPAP